MEPSGERLDDLQLNGYFIYQNPSRYCFGVDAVCLSDFAVVKNGEKVLDLCAGNGIIPILLCGKTKASHVTGIEIDPYGCGLANRSAARNGLGDRISVICGDIKKVSDYTRGEVFDAVTTNPPYIEEGAGKLPADAHIASARHETCLCLRDVVSAAAVSLAPAGRFYMVHRPDRLADAIVVMRDFNLEPKTLRFVHSDARKPPVLFLIEGIKNAGRQLNVLPPQMI